MSDSTPARQQEAAQIVREAVLSILPALPEREITSERHLKDLGADSVDRVEIILAIIDRLGIEESMSSFDSILKVGALIDYVSKRVQR